MEYFEYKDVDYLLSPSYWLEARLKNKLNEGYEITRNHQNMSWVGLKQDTSSQ